MRWMDCHSLTARSWDFPADILATLGLCWKDKHTPGGFQKGRVSCCSEQFFQSNSYRCPSGDQCKQKMTWDEAVLGQFWGSFAVFALLMACARVTIKTEQLPWSLEQEPPLPFWNCCKYRFVHIVWAGIWIYFCLLFPSLQWDHTLLSLLFFSFNFHDLTG